MFSKVVLHAAVLGLFFASATFGGDTYQIDPSHSSVAFSVRHLVINKVRGNFKEFSGTISYDEADIAKSSVDVNIKAASINTENEGRDNHLRSPEFFDAENHPEITFVSKQISKKGEELVVSGEFTMHGVTKEVSIPFEVVGKIVDPWGKTRIGIEASLTLNRQDYGVSWSNAMDNGGLVVGNEVRIELNIEAVKQ